MSFASNPSLYYMIVFALNGAIAPTDIPELCERVGALVDRSGTSVVVCDVGDVVAPDAATVDALARLQLTARRRGCRMRLRHVSHELQELLYLTGLCEVVPALVLESVGKTEEREEVLGVEEEADPGDTTV